MELVQGMIVSAIGGFYYVETPEGVAECRASGKLRLLKQPPLVGDRCKIQRVGDKEGYVEELLPRKSALKRPAVANLDKLFIICSKAPPVTDLFLVDKLSVIAEHEGIEPVIVVNKWDLAPGEDLQSLYAGAGLPVICASAATGQGAEELRKASEGCLSAFTGNSGVGKSSLLNRMAPGFALETAHISRRIGRGRHTTRQVSLLRLPGHTYIADTPGFSSFDLEEMGGIRKEDLAFAFREFRPLQGGCRFADCSHTKEIGCVVLEAVSEGRISRGRHESYVKMYESLRNIKDWETN